MELFVEKPIMIGQHEVEITKDGIKVGCKTVSRDRVLEIVDFIKREGFTCDDGTPIHLNRSDKTIIVERVTFPFSVAEQIASKLQ